MFFRHIVEPCVGLRPDGVRLADVLHPIEDALARHAPLRSVAVVVGHTGRRL